MVQEICTLNLWWGKVSPKFAKGLYWGKEKNLENFEATKSGVGVFVCNLCPCTCGT